MSRRARDSPTARAASSRPWDVDAVARAVLLMASLPAEANIQNLTVLASGMPFVGRG